MDADIYFIFQIHSSNNKARIFFYSKITE
uniref:Uncharacterized protein n=1 Tax=Anguilla anguilla TaxID=7936 RepID=A0A0E9QR90_ANGAN